MKITKKIIMKIKTTAAVVSQPKARLSAFKTGSSNDKN